MTSDTINHIKGDIHMKTGSLNWQGPKVRKVTWIMQANPFTCTCQHPMRQHELTSQNMPMPGRAQLLIQKKVAASHPWATYLEYNIMNIKI